jgi:hypothetical protein
MSRHRRVGSLLERNVSVSPCKHECGYAQKFNGYSVIKQNRSTMTVDLPAASRSVFRAGVMFPFSALVKKINEKHLIYNYEYDFSEMYY